jgi:hypothetical protein
MLEDNKFMVHSFFETKPTLGLYGLNDRVCEDVMLKEYDADFVAGSSL